MSKNRRETTLWRLKNTSTPLAWNQNEEHLFAWGSELLSHRTYEPAMAVFTRGV